MGYQDVYCWSIATQIMVELFFVNFKSLINADEPNLSFTYLNNLLLEEKNNILSQKQVTYKYSFDNKERDNIIYGTIDILCDKLGIDGDRYDEYGIDWLTFNEIILHYSNIILEKQMLNQLLENK